MLDSPEKLLPPHHQYEDFLDAETSRRLLEWVLSNAMRFEPSTVGSDELDPRVRVSAKTASLGPWRRVFEDRIRSIAPDIFRRTGTASFPIKSIELEIAAHGDGAHFAKHRDVPIGGARSRDGSRGEDRVVSAVYYFHREPRRFSGGELRLYAFGEADDRAHLDIAPLRNSLVVFPSWVVHEVRPVSCPGHSFAESRFAVNCWLCKEL